MIKEQKTCKNQKFGKRSVLFYIKVAFLFIPILLCVLYILVLGYEANSYKNCLENQNANDCDAIYGL